jgi:hypothetical protein
MHMKRQLIFAAVALLVAIGTTTFAGLIIDPRTEVSDSLAAQTYGGAPVCTNWLSENCGTKGVNGCTGVAGFNAVSSDTTSYGYANGTTTCGGTCGSVATSTAACATVTTVTIPQ